MAPKPGHSIGTPLRWGWHPRANTDLPKGVPETLPSGGPPRDAVTRDAKLWCNVESFEWLFDLPDVPSQILRVTAGSGEPHVFRCAPLRLASVAARLMNLRYPSGEQPKFSVENFTSVRSARLLGLVSRPDARDPQEHLVHDVPYRAVRGLLCRCSDDPEALGMVQWLLSSGAPLSGIARMALDRPGEVGL